MLAALCSILLNGAPNDYEGKPIASVQFDPAVQPLTLDQLLAMLPLRVGQPLRASDLRDSIQRLYQTGEYADIAVDATLAPGGSGPEVHHQARVFHWILRRERRWRAAQRRSVAGGDQTHPGRNLLAHRHHRGGHADN